MQDDATVSIPRFRTFRAKNTSQRYSFRLPEFKKSRSKSPENRSRHTWREPCGLDRDRSESSPGKLFEIDGTGDEKNLLYGSLKRSSIPLYKRSGHGKLLGIPQDHTYELVNGNSSGSIVINATRSSRSPLLSLHQSPEKLSHPHRLLLVRSIPAAGDKEAQDFISVAENAEDKDSEAATAFAHPTNTGIGLGQSRENEGFSWSTQDHHNGIFLHVNSPSTQVKADRLPVVTGNSEHSSLDNVLQAIRDAEGASKATFSFGVAEKLIEQKSLAEIRLSICEKALQQAWEDEAIDTLMVCWMKEARLVWEEPKLRRKWKSLLKPGRPQLWLLYADHLKTSVMNFQFDQVRQAYLDCIEICQASSFGRDVSRDSLANLHATGLSAILHMSHFVLEAGYTELAVSTLQSLLDFAILNPSKGVRSQPPTVDERTQELQAFESYWDSELPRIGEADSNGRPPDANSEFAMSCENSRSKLGSNPSAQQFYAQWALSEREKALRFYLPARITEDRLDIDPFRVVLFSDISPSLLTFDPSFVSSRDIVNTFLRFFHLPIVPGSKTQDFTLDMFVNCQPSEWTAADFAHPMHLRINNFTLDQHTMFSYAQWPLAFRSVNGCTSSLATAFLLRSLESLVCTSGGGEDLAEYALSIELQLSPDTVRGKAKKFLKRMPSSLRLYNALALIEFRLGNPQKARSILVKSLHMTARMDSSCQTQSVILWRTMLWELLNTCKYREALEQSLFFGKEMELLEDLPVGNQDPLAAQPSSILQTEKRLRDRLELLLQFSQFELAAIAVECLILHSYLQRPGDIGAVVPVFREARQHLQNQNVTANEMIHQSLAHLIYFHIENTHVVRLVEIRELLEELIDAFPLNTIFMSLYAWNESRLQIDDRLHSKVNNMVLRSEHKVGESIVLYSFLIDLEMVRHKKGIVQASSVRSTFERAIISEVCAHSVSLWQSYIMFEIKERKWPEAERVLFRAISACPWVKEFFLLAFENVCGPAGMDEGKLQGLRMLLEERGLRLHEPFEV